MPRCRPDYYIFPYSSCDQEVPAEEDVVVSGPHTERRHPEGGHVSHDDFPLHLVNSVQVIHKYWMYV